MWVQFTGIVVTELALLYPGAEENIVDLAVLYLTPDYGYLPGPKPGI